MKNSRRKSYLRKNSPRGGLATLPPYPPPLSPSRHPEVPYAYAASLGVVADAARPSTKTSLKYTYTEDLRDDPFVPTMGSYIQASVEGAGEKRRETGGGGGAGRQTCF